MTEDLKPSKSELKRRYTALQELREKLIGLSASQLDTLPLGSELRAAIDHAARIGSHSALRRQRQLIGKLMRDADGPAIEEGFLALGSQERAAKRVFRQAEQWRDRIAQQGADAINAYAQASGSDSGELSLLYQEYRNEHSDKGRKIALRRIFRLIHEQLESVQSTGSEKET